MELWRLSKSTMFSTNNACAKKVQEFLTKLGSFLKKKGQSIEDTGEHSVLQHPWQNDLDHLANRLGEVPCKIAEKPTDEQMKKLCEDAKAVRKSTKEMSSPSKTAVDLKAWWGNSVATWDPNADAQNLDSIHQQRRPRKTKWFD